MSIAQPNASPTHGFVTVTQEMTQAGNSLQNHPTQSATTIDGWSSVLFGLPFLLIGIFIEGSALNLHPVHGKNAPSWLIAMVGSFFFLPGTFLVIHGITGLAHKMRYRREGALHPGQVWFADYHWHKEGFRFSAFGALLGRLSFALFWSAFLVPFFWAGLRGAWPFLIGGSFFALIGLFIWYRAFQMFADLFRYGNTFLQYDNFPYFLGSTLNAQLRAPDHLADIDELTFTFRCVAERYLTGGSGRNRNSQVVCYELYKDVASFPRERLAAFAGGAIPVQFTIPADQPSTSLISTPPTYWEIEARGKGREADYEAYFLVPVYPAS